MTRMIILVLVALAAIGCETERFPLSPRGTLALQPDTSQASTAPYAPTASEVATFDDLYSKAATKQEVLRFMGHPSDVTVGEDGMERWHYPWRTSCKVIFAGDTVQGVLLVPRAMR